MELARAPTIIIRNEKRRMFAGGPVDAFVRQRAAAGGRVINRRQTKASR